MLVATFFCDMLCEVKLKLSTGGLLVKDKN